MSNFTTELDEHFSSVVVCPITREQLTHSMIHRADGVCHWCGHVAILNITHYEVLSGKWSRTYKKNIFGFKKQMDIKFIEKKDLL